MTLQNVLVHPCFNEKAHHTYARIHLPVAETCNIQCKYCSRAIGITYHSYRPAVASKIMSPEEAVNTVSQYVTVDDTLKVVGIAGPGEPLCNKATYETLSLVHNQFPDLLLCIATNGLLLPEKVALLSKLGVKTVTVTINTVNPDTIPKIYTHIQGKMDTKTAEKFIESQLTGIELCVSHQMIVKVNSILIPGISKDLEKVAVKVYKKGAYIQNITPLIPLAEFSGMRPPTCEEIQTTRKKCENILPQFRLCKQCRADAVGIPGKKDKHLY
ncbi:MAG: radical SAM protein [Candidatus Methanofastidiosia archaeon]